MRALKVSESLRISFSVSLVRQDVRSISLTLSLIQDFQTALV